MDSNQAMFRDRLEKLCGSFESARATYFQRLRQETAGLALAIAERILHRELQLDPTLMRDAVHVALAQLSSSTRFKLRVPISEQTAWEEHFSLLNKSEGIPEILPDERMDPGECRIETELGSARLGISAQLEEIASRISRSATSTSRHLDRTPMDGSSLVDWQRNTPSPAQPSTPEPDAPSSLGPTFQAVHGDQGARL